MDSLEVRRILSERFGWVCWYCGVRLYKDGGHVDHIIPRCDGGVDTLENFALACHFCNMAKAYHSLDAFMDWLEWLRSGNSYSSLNTDLAAIKELIECSRPPVIGNCESQVTRFKCEEEHEEKMKKVAEKTKIVNELISDYSQLISLTKTLPQVRRALRRKNSKLHRNKSFHRVRSGSYVEVILCKNCKKEAIVGLGVTLCQRCR